MLARTLLAAGAAVSFAAIADAHAVRVVGGNTEAVACYRAADSDAPRADALPICDRALETGQLDRVDQVATFVNRGTIRFRLADFAGATADFDAAMAIDPGQPDAMINKGITMLASGESIESASSLIDAGLSRGPQRPWIGYYARAVANELAGRDAAAYRDYRRAQELRPSWQLPQRALARFSVRS